MRGHTQKNYLQVFLSQNLIKEAKTSNKDMDLEFLLSSIMDRQMISVTKT